MKLSIVCLLILLFISPTTHAHNNKGYYKARVLDVSPVFRYKKDRVHHRNSCSNNYSKRSNHDHGAVAAGSVVGGVIGHAAGKKGNKGLTTLAGAIIGGVVADKLTHQNYDHCKTRRRDGKEVRVLTGYNVTYRHQGRVYKTFRENRPGKRIRIYN